MANTPVDVLKGIYIFAFRPEDDFSGVKIINPGNQVITGEQLEKLKSQPNMIRELAQKPNGWHLTTDRAPAGTNAAQFSGQGDAISGWLFSCAFHFEAGREYEAGIHFSGEHTETQDRPAKGVMPASVVNRQRLQLRLGKEQTPEAMTQNVFDVGVTSSTVQLIKGSFTVSKTGTYYFSLQAHTVGRGVIIVLDNSGGPDGSLKDF